jgi:DNA-binding transcriptional ArsR family regulator
MRPRSSRARAAAREDRLDAIFHALADRTRRALVARLERAPASISELAEPFAMSFPAVSKHVRVLELAGLVAREVDGRVHRCALEPGPLREIDAWVAHYRSFWDDTLDALAAHVEGDRIASRKLER